LLKTFHLTFYGGHCPANLKGIAMEQKITIAATGTVTKEETAHLEHQADDTFGFEAIAPKKGRTPKPNYLADDQLWAFEHCAREFG